MTKLEQHRQTWQGKSDEWLFERLANELTQKVEEIHKLLAENEQLRLSNVVRSLPNKEEILFEPISNALYATNRFTTDQCTDLTNGIIQYIDDYKIDVIKK